jgi:hypothetical protein
VPYLELWKVHMPNGDTHTSHNWGLNFALAVLLTGAGLLTALFGMIGLM